ncbi:hypothetical protein AAVH_14759 [Aphelenchoides avenae]|nr:hypothetical protein AAVH_14759 [Aphelenchus avenae]
MTFAAFASFFLCIIPSVDGDVTVVGNNNVVRFNGSSPDLDRLEFGITGNGNAVCITGEGYAIINGVKRPLGPQPLQVTGDGPGWITDPCSPAGEADLDYYADDYEDDEDKVASAPRYERHQ